MLCLSLPPLSYPFLTQRSNRMSWNDMIYEYDGTYEGFLCCIFESYVNKEFPIAFVSNEEFPVLSILFALWRRT